MKDTALKIAFALIVGCALPASALGSREPPLTGWVGHLLIHPVRAADFTLTDQHRNPFHMADTAGKVVLMTFIYTHCEDTCPFVALKVKDAYELLTSDADKVAIVAVTTDPKRDVPEVTAAYSKALGLFDVWHFVGGAASAVQRVWTKYGIGVTVDPTTDAVAASSGGADTLLAQDSHYQPTEGLTPSDLFMAEHIIQQFGGGYDVGHSAPFWIVDKKGMIRLGLDASATPSDIAADVRLLLTLK